jgi:hypothetical protein
MTHFAVSLKCQSVLWICFVAIAFWSNGVIAPPSRALAADECLEVDMRVLSLNPWSEQRAGAELPIDPHISARHAEALRQMAMLAMQDRALEFHWAEVRPRRPNPGEVSPVPGQVVPLFQGEVALRYNLSKGAAEDRHIAYQWNRKGKWVGGGGQEERRERDKAILLNIHRLFVVPEAPQENPPLSRTGVLAFSAIQRPIPKSLEFAMGMPDCWQPLVKECFVERERLAAGSPAELLGTFKPTSGHSNAESVLTQVFALLRLRDMTLSAAEQFMLAKLTRPEGDFIMDSLWLSQWMIALYAHENSVDLGKRLDAMADAELAKDKTVNRKVFMMLVASMASYAHVIDSPDVPFTPPKQPDEVAGAFYVARVNHVRDAVAKLPRESLSDWGKSIANYQFMPPYAPWPPEPAKEQSPKE